MVDRRAWSLVRIAMCGALLGCSAQVGDADVGALSAALDACGESVPANRNVDGIPAYAQCDAIASGPIFSNNGVDTSATSMGADWIKTQYSGGYQCTEFAHRYLHFKWKVKWLPNGNAGEWCDTMPPASSGMVQTTTPVHGDIMVLEAGSCGAGVPTGHVNIIDTVDGNGRVTVVEQNRAGRNQYMQSCGKCFLHVVANDGMGGDGSGGSGAGGATPGTGGKGGTGGASGASGAGGKGGAGGAGGAAGMSGAGGMMASPTPQAGAAAPMQESPPKVVPAGSGGAGGSSSVTPVSTSPELTSNRQPAEDCSVSHVGAASGSTPFALFALSLCAYGVRRRVRRARSAA